jgi:hypothetical protein
MDDKLDRLSHSRSLNQYPQESIFNTSIKTTNSVEQGTFSSSFSMSESSLSYFSWDISVTKEQPQDPILLEHFLVLPIMLVFIVHETTQSFLVSPQGHHFRMYFGLLLIPDIICDVYILVVWMAFVETFPTRDNRETGSWKNRKSGVILRSGMGNNK